jgi:hypothetical protein
LGAIQNVVGSVLREEAFINDAEKSSNWTKDMRREYQDKALQFNIL